MTNDSNGGGKAPRANRIIRRSVLTGVGAAATAGILSTLVKPGVEHHTPSGPAVHRKRLELKMVTTWPKDFPGLGTSANRFAEKLTAATDGEITVQVFAAGELVPPLGVFDAVQRGTADLYHGAEYYWQGKSPAFAFFAAVPFGLNADELSAWVRWGGGQALWDELSAPYGIKPFQAANSGVQMGGWYKKELRTLEDFKGLKVRMPGLGGEVLSRMGASPSTLPGGEIYQALQSGRIDGTEWAGPWNDVAFGFQEVAKYYYYPGFHEPGTAMTVGINLDVWGHFTPAQKQIFASVASDEFNTSLAEFNAENARSYQEILAMPDVKVLPFPDDVMKEIARLSAEVVAEAGNADEMSRRVYESYSAFRKRAVPYNRISEYAFARARLLEAGFLDDGKA